MEVSGGGRHVAPAAADFPRDVCLTVLRNHKVFVLYALPGLNGLTDQYIETLTLPWLLYDGIKACHFANLTLQVANTSVPAKPTCSSVPADATEFIPQCDSSWNINDCNSALYTVCQYVPVAKSGHVKPQLREALTLPPSQCILLSWLLQYSWPCRDEGFLGCTDVTNPK